jgi:hypothetical protein
MPSVHRVHPEFGYFCPTPRLRRDVRVAAVSIVLGTIIGAGVITLRAAHDRDTESALAMTHVAHSSVDSGVNGEAASIASKAEAVKVDRMRIESPKADIAKSPNGDAANRDKGDKAKVEGVKTESAKVESAKTDGRNIDGAKADAAKPACDDSTWARLDGTCLAPKPRRVRVRAGTDSPAIAAAPIGRPSSNNVGTPAGAAATTPSTAQSPAAPNPPSASANATPPASQPSTAAPRKPQRIAHSQARHRARDAAANRGMVATNAGGPFGGGFLGMQWPWR